MKPIPVYFVLLSLCIPYFCSAQSSTQKKAELYLGGSLSYNIGNLKVGETSYYNRADFSNYKNIGGGLVFHFKTKKPIFLQTELTYTKKKVTDEAVNVFPFSQEDIYSNVAFDFAYLNFPILIGYNFSSGTLRPYLAAGIHIGAALKKDLIDIPNTDLPSWKTPATPPIVLFESNEYGALLEAGIQKQLNRLGLLMASIRYTGTEVTYKVLSTNEFGEGKSNLAGQRISISIGALIRLNKN